MKVTVSELLGKIDSFLVDAKNQLKVGEHYGNKQTIKTIDEVINRLDDIYGLLDRSLTLGTDLGELEVDIQSSQE